MIECALPWVEGDPWNARAVRLRNVAEGKKFCIECGAALPRRRIEGSGSSTASRCGLHALRELTRRCIFVKRDIVGHLWPNLYDLMQRDFAGLLQLERQALQPETCIEEELA
jgi:hypothetical protein